MHKKSYPGLQDTLNRCEPFGGERKSFYDAYPEVESIRIEYTEDYRHPHEYGSKNQILHVLTDTRMIGEYLRCSNPNCKKGGMKIAEHINEIVIGKIKEKTGNSPCLGNDMLYDSIRKRPCSNSFHWKITITYQDDNSE